MRAAVVTAHGEPASYAEHPGPTLAGGDVEVRITAAPLVPLDLLCASGTSYFGPPALPYVPGVQGVGVTAAGERVWVASSAGMRPGDGTLAETYVAAPDDVVPLAGRRRPTKWPPRSACPASRPGVPSTVRAALQPGETVLVLGAGGAVGQAAVGVAVARGAGRVVGGLPRRGGSRARASQRGRRGGDPA